jgi:hypothetical protein
MAAITVIAGLALATGAIISIVGSVVQTQQAAAAAAAAALTAQIQAAHLAELSRAGGYYDQVLESIRLDIADVEADRAQAGKMLAISATEVGLAKTKINTQERQATSADVQVLGHISSRAGAGNLAQTGSVEQQKGIVEQNISENKAVSNANRKQLDLEMQKTRLQYEDALRGLATRQAGDNAQQTLTAFKKTSGMEDANALLSGAASLTNEANWLSTWGVALTIGSGVAGAIGGLAGLSGLSLGALVPGGQTTSTGTAYGDPYASMLGVGWNSSYWRSY